MLSSFFPARSVAPLNSGAQSHARFRLPAQSVTSLRLNAGDKLSIEDTEGSQNVAIAAFGKNAQALTATINDLDTDPANEINRWLENTLEIACDHGRWLLKQTKHPSSKTITIPTAMQVYIAAPADDMSLEQPIPPTDIYLNVYRQQTTEQDNHLPVLPPPVTDTVVKEVRVNRCTAESVTIKAGEYIQIIDVEGRQCSDFVVFEKQALKKGTERQICPVTTRTLMGSAYPEPGLYNKYYNADMTCLVEIIQDTIGRHDTFNLACSAKYYDDIGYPGHINCSDNLNACLADYGVSPKKSWPAINFFFNTGYDDSNQGTSAQPWSRAGDYVILQAQTDLVCGITACPDDTSNANDWQPSDIHVRVYSHDSKIPLGVAHRNFPEADYTMTKKTTFHDSFAQLTQHFTNYNGYWLANHFSNYGAIKEYWACREGVVMTDLSPLRKYEILGPDAENLLNYAVTRNIRQLAIGQVVYTAMCYENGGMIDDGTVFRLNQDNFRWVGGCDTSGQWLRQIAQAKNFDVIVKESTDQLHTLPIQGPLSRDLLNQVMFTADCQTSINDLGWFRTTHARIGDAMGIPVMISRTGYTGELGYEVWCHPKHGAAVWQAIWDAGQTFNITPLGLEALDMLRVEAGLIFAGHELDDQTDPFEAGISFTVPLKTKIEDFIGREALIERQQHPKHKLVGLVLDGAELAEHGDCVRIGRQQVGIITSGIRSPILKQSIALCRISINYSEIGTRVEVGKLDGHLKRLPAQVVGLSHYDPSKSRVRV